MLPKLEVKVRGRKRGRMGTARKLALSSNSGVLLTATSPEAQAWAQSCHILEIGFGMGQHLLELSQKHPNKRVLGVDLYLPGIASALLAAQRAQLDNLAIINCSAQELLASTNMQLEQIYIHFPDPWPKRRHRSRRLVNSAFLDQLAERCRIGARLHLATDDAHYAQSMLEDLHAHQQWRNSTPPAFSPRLQRNLSKFEQRAATNAQATFELSFKRCDPGNTST